MVFWLFQECMSIRIIHYYVFRFLFGITLNISRNVDNKAGVRGVRCVNYTQEMQVRELPTYKHGT